MMKLDFTVKAPPEERGPRLARLTRHLKARMVDFGPGGPQVLEADQERGMVAVRFPKGTAQAVAELERSCGVSAALEGERAVFYLRGGTRFESLDYVWGCLFELL